MSTTAAGTPTKLLVVDDIPENLVAMGALLRSDAWEVITARSGREALELVLVHDFALVLLDVNMPEMDGFEVAELMRGMERTRTVPIIFVTASPREAQPVFQGYDAGAVDFLFKPVDGRILRHKVETFRALHEQKQALRDQLAERERLADELAAALKLNEMFVAAVGHDLRSPLAAITTAGDVLERMVAEPAAAKIVERLQRSSRRMAQMIDQLNDLARARLGGGLPLDREPVDLREVVDEVVREFRVARPEVAIEVRAEGAVVGQWDRGRLGRVASNLVGNAIQHGQAAGGVRIFLRGGDGGVALEVWNAGAIPPDALEHIFEPFRRGVPGKVRTGMGLGLYIVREIAAAHGGGVAVDSGPERGTRFTVELPRG